MAGGLVGGALLGTVVGMLLEAIVDAGKTAWSFKSNLKHMESILIQLVPIINEIEQLNEALDISKDETSDLMEKLKQGATIVRKCAKVRSWHYVNRYKYSAKLQELEKLLDSIFTMVVRAQAARDIKLTLFEVRDLKIKLRRLSKKGSGSGGGGSHKDSFIGLPSGRNFGLDVPLIELKRTLFKNDVQVLTLTAPRGYGKTTLVKSLCVDKDVQDKFGENIIFITVTKTASLEYIVQRIFHKYSDELPDFLNDEDAIIQVETLLRDRGPNPILLVLDDVWSGSESLIEKFRFSLPDCKILVSSRFEYPGFGPLHCLEPLSDEDALSLFRHFAKNSDSQDQNIVKKVVKCCKGIPLALKVVGGSLSGQPPSIWKAKEMKFSEGVSVLESND